MRRNLNREVPDESSNESDTSTEEETSDGDEEGSEDELNSRIAVSKRVRDPKSKLIAAVLSRWWYVLPQWPPPSYDYTEALNARKLRLVPISEWEAADDVDEEGFTKVYEVTYFPGVFRDPEGKPIDLRPLEGKPCFSELAKLPDVALQDLLVQALRKQISLLEQSPYQNTEGPALQRILNSLKMELQVAEQAASPKSFKRSKTAPS